MQDEVLVVVSLARVGPKVSITSQTHYVVVDMDFQNDVDFQLISGRI